MALAYLASGLDAEFAWKKAAGEPRLTPWRDDPTDPADVRAWLACLRELHATGAPLRETITAFATHLEESLNLDLDRHVESAPRKAQVALLVFFAPGAFFVLLYPWLRSLL